MSANCCHNKEKDLQKLIKSQARVLWIVLFINFGMFFVEFISGILSQSVSLTGDSLDMLGDGLAYASSLWALKLTQKDKARSAQFKASIMMVLGVFVFGRAIYKVFFQSIPHFQTIGAIGLLAMIMNLICLFLLTRHKNDDINFTSVWICSRNDIIANTSLLIAAFLVFYFQHPWPDLIVGFGITVLFLRSSLGIFSEAKTVLKNES